MIVDTRALKTILKDMKCFAWYFFFFFFWLCQILIAACGIFRVACWDLVS